MYDENERREKIHYTYFIAGILGPALVGAVAMWHIARTPKDDIIYLILFGGLLLSMSYINYLEKKAGVSQKVIWLRAGITILLFIASSLILYFCVK